DPQVVADVLLTGYAANIVGLHADATQFAASPGERPIASALARMQSKQGPLVSNLPGASVSLAGPGAPRFLQLLDGTRDRDQLARAFAELCRSEMIRVEKAGRQVNDLTEMTEVLRRELDE